MPLQPPLLVWHIFQLGEQIPTHKQIAYEIYSKYLVLQKLRIDGHILQETFFSPRLEGTKLLQDPKSKSPGLICITSSCHRVVFLSNWGGGVVAIVLNNIPYGTSALSGREDVQRIVEPGFWASSTDVLTAFLRP